MKLNNREVAQTKRLQHRRRGAKQWQWCYGEAWTAIETLRNRRKLLKTARMAAGADFEFRLKEAA